MQGNSPRNKSIASSPASKAADRPTCSTCGYFDADDDRCRRSPVALDRKPSDWCGEHSGFPEYLAAIKAR